MSERQYARCPRCGASDGLVLIEVHEEYGETEAGRHEVFDGAILPCSEFVFSPGDPVRVEMRCEPCGHAWRSRRSVAA